MTSHRPRTGSAAVRRRGVAAVVAAVLVVSACSTSDAGTEAPGSAADGDDGTPGAVGAGAFRYPAPPPAPDADAPEDPTVRDAVEAINARLVDDAELDTDGVEALATAGDARHAWFVTDLMRFFSGGSAGLLVDAFEQLTATSLDDDPDLDRSPWLSATNHMIAWDTPAYPDYRDDKSGIFLLVEPAWVPFFADDDADIDWRLVSWGGVLIDDRELGDTAPCERGCIPALDDPAVTDAAGGDWYPDDEVVFGIVEGDEVLAIPRNIAEIHEMFNLTLGDRRFAIPYCTLCGAAQAYRTDDAAATGGADEVPVLRTSGLLSRSNKVMYDLRTDSVFDTFTGAAVSGPLQEAGTVLEETTVVRTTWGEWKADHPDTTIVAEDGGIGRSYPLDPLGGRDDDGPIFPVGDVDERLDVQEFVVGVITADGAPVAFPADVARDTLAAGEAVAASGIELVADGGGLRAVDESTGESVPSHEAFWFAWSQFHPDTALWAP